MVYKSEASAKLYRINQDVRVSKEIFLDNVPNQTGYNIEMQRVERL